MLSPNYKRKVHVRYEEGGETTRAQSNLAKAASNARNVHNFIHLIMGEILPPPTDRPPCVKSEKLKMWGHL